MKFWDMRYVPYIGFGSTVNSGSAFENIICTILCVVRGSAIQCRDLKKPPPESSRSQDRNCRSIIPEFTYYIHV